MKKHIKEKNWYCENCANSYIAEIRGENGQMIYSRKCTCNVALCLLQNHADFKPIKKDGKDSKLAPVCDEQCS